MVLKERLVKIIDELYQTIFDYNNNNKITGIPLMVSAEVIFSEACSFLRGEFSNENWVKNNVSKRKDWQNPNYKAKQTSVSPSSKSKFASGNQIAFIQKLSEEKGVDVNITEDMTSIEASQLIESLKSMGGNNNG